MGHGATEVNRAILIHKDRVLLVRNRGNTFWSLPGGKRDPGETSSECLRREINEELRIALDGLQLIGAISMQKNSITYYERYWKSTVNDDQVDAIDPDTGLEGELDEVIWVDEAAIDTLDVYPRDLIKQAIATSGKTRS